LDENRVNNSRENGCEYYHDVFSQPSQITGLLGGINRFCKSHVLTHSSGASQTDGQTDKQTEKQCQYRNVYYAALAKTV